MELAQQFHGDLASLVRKRAPNPKGGPRPFYRLALKPVSLPPGSGGISPMTLPPLLAPGGRYDPARGPVVPPALVDPLRWPSIASVQRQSRWQESSAVGRASCCPAPPAVRRNAPRPTTWPSGAGRPLTPSPPANARCSSWPYLRGAQPVGDRQPAAAAPRHRQNPCASRADRLRNPVNDFAAQAMTLLQPRDDRDNLRIPSTTAGSQASRSGDLGTTQNAIGSRCGCRQAPELNRRPGASSRAPLHLPALSPQRVRGPFPLACAVCCSIGGAVAECGA